MPCRRTPEEAQSEVFYVSILRAPNATLSFPGRPFRFAYACCKISVEYTFVTHPLYLDLRRDTGSVDIGLRDPG